MGGYFGSGSNWLQPRPPGQKIAGEVTEWLKVHDWKSCGGPKAFPRVRIPPSPPKPSLLTFQVNFLWHS